MRKHLVRIVLWLALAPMVVFIGLWITGTLWNTPVGKVFLALIVLIWIVGTVLSARYLRTRKPDSRTHQR